MQRYFAKDIIDKKVLLLDSDYHHINKVMRMKNNDKIEVIYNEKLYIANIDSIDDKIINITEQLDENNELDVDISVAVGLVKEQKIDLILQKLTELGVNNIIPVMMERSIVKLDDKSRDKKLIRWNSICKEASEQSKRNKIPNIYKPVSLKELIKIKCDLKLVASTNSDVDSISNYLKGNYKSILIVIGPEGGISEKEEKYLNENGFASISLGKRILRVETACIYVASVVGYSRM